MKTAFDIGAFAAAALAAAAKAGVARAMPAYRRGRRYLRMNGILEMSAADMARDARAAEKRLVGSDPGLARSVTLAARL